ncbi:MAG TPA: hypothetical protein VF463_13980 [Sphingobium sp.]
MSASQPTSRHALNDIGTAPAQLSAKDIIWRLVLAEPHDDIVSAIAREKALKAWQREWKIRLVGDSNPDWRDLSDLLF